MNHNNRMKKRESPRRSRPPVETSLFAQSCQGQISRLYIIRPNGWIDRRQRSSPIRAIPPPGTRNVVAAVRFKPGGRSPRLTRARISSIPLSVSVSFLTGECGILHRNSHPLPLAAGRLRTSTSRIRCLAESETWGKRKGDTRSDAGMRTRCLSEYNADVPDVRGDGGVCPSLKRTYRTREHMWDGCMYTEGVPFYRFRTSRMKSGNTEYYYTVLRTPCLPASKHQPPS